MMTEYKTLPAKLAFMATAVLWPALCGRRESCTCVTHITEDHGAKSGTYTPNRLFNTSGGRETGFWTIDGIG